MGIVFFFTWCNADEKNRCKAWREAWTWSSNYNILLRFRPWSRLNRALLINQPGYLSKEFMAPLVCHCDIPQRSSPWRPVRLQSTGVLLTVSRMLTVRVIKCLLPLSVRTLERVYRNLNPDSYLRFYKVIQTVWCLSFAWLPSRYVGKIYMEAEDLEST